MANGVMARRVPMFAGVAAGLLGVAVLLTVTQLDAWIQARLQQEADAIALRLGRPVGVGAVHTSLSHGELTLDSFTVGAAPGESASLLSVGPVRAKLELGAALRSRGEVLNVHSVELDALVLNVERRADGSTNLGKVARAWAASAPAAPANAPPGSPSRPFDLRVGFVKLSGKVRLLAPSAVPVELPIQSLTLDELQWGRPLAGTLRASVLSRVPNLDLHVTTAPLVRDRRPKVELLRLQLASTDLAPLAPFFPQGPQSGTLQADLTAQLGALVRGGSGPTQISGKVEARGLHFRAEGAEPLDALLDVDLSGDARRGDLELRRLLMKLGPAEVKGQGEAKGLLTRTPEVKGLHVVAQQLDPALLARHYPPLRELLEGMSGPVALSLEGVGGQSRPGLMLNVDGRELTLARPHAFTKAPGAPLRLSLRANGGLQGSLELEGNADLTGLDLRPGGHWNKPADVPLRLAATGRYRPSGAGPGTAELTLTTLRVEARSEVLTGSAHATWNAGTVRDVEASLSGARLDLDALLLPPALAPAAAPAPAPSGPGNLNAPPAVSHHQGRARITLGALHFKETDFTSVDAQAVWTDDTIRFPQLRARVHGGSVSMDGSELDVSPGGPRYVLHGRASGLEMSALLPRTVKPDLVTGLFSGTLSLQGKGLDRAAMGRTLNGTLEGKILDGTFKGGDLVAQLAGPLARTLSLDPAALGNQTTSLGHELPFALQFGGGSARLARPLHIEEPRGALTLEGAIQLDGKLALQGSVALAPQTVSQITKGQVTLSAPLPVGFHLTGMAWDPKVSDLDLSGVLKVVADQAAHGGLRSLLGNDPQAVENRKRLEEKAKQGLKKLLGH